MKVEIDAEVLQSICDSLFVKSQGGHLSYKGGGQWGFIAAGIEMTPAHINACFEALGQQPVVIVPQGFCSTCKNAIGGRERGYREPCLTCKRPKMSNWQAADVE